MRSRSRDISVFNISALDLFAAALGAFILIVLILFPYYQRGGSDESMEELEELVRKRRLAASSAQTEMAKIRVIQAEIKLMDKQYLTSQENISAIEDRIQELLKQTADIQVPDPPPIPKPIPKPPTPPKSVSRGVDFSILGLATNRKKVVIVVDMSGSMSQYRTIATNAVIEVLSQMKKDHEFSIVGYGGNVGITKFPSSGQLVKATPSTLQQAASFAQGLPRRFGGGTPTQSALLQAMRMRPEAIILLSDGEPTDGAAGTIIAGITRQNRGSAEIHTVAIGDYTSDKRLMLFLQELANRNRGEFVGISR